ncbi:hypothetical protein GCM10027093_68500 [Paraburkholderia jirisanensis]
MIHGASLRIEVDNGWHNGSVPDIRRDSLLVPNAVLHDGDASLRAAESCKPIRSRRGILRLRAHEDPVDNTSVHGVCQYVDAQILCPPGLLQNDFAKSFARARDDSVTPGQTKTASHHTTDPTHSYHGY